MPEIFISYSSLDKAPATALVDALRQRGYDVWIDLSGIDAATSWSKEIAKALSDCSALLLLLSENSISSRNVAKEVAVAAELNKPIVPIEIDSVQLRDEFLYHLAGLQRVRHDNTDAISIALEKLGIRSEAAPLAPSSGEGAKKQDAGFQPATRDGRKSLMVLPFEDLSPAKDNGWFADGLTSELIVALGNIKSLRIIDVRTSMDFKGYRGKTAVIAEEFDVRYFLEGSIRMTPARPGESGQIKISVSLLDVYKDENLWQDSWRGQFSDIFDIQEGVSNRVVEGLKLTLTHKEKSVIAEHPTTNSEAYELSMRAEEYFRSQTRDGLRLAVQLWSDAIRVDPNLAEAYKSKAAALVEICRNFEHSAEELAEAESLSRRALEIKPDLFAAYHPLSAVQMLQGKLDEAEAVAREFVRKAPGDAHAHFALGYFFMTTGRPAEAIAPYEEAVRINPNALSLMWNLVICCDNADQVEKCMKWAEVAIPLLEKHLRFHPGDEQHVVMRGILYMFAKRLEDAREATKHFSGLRDGNSLYNAGCLLVGLGEKREGLKTLVRAIDAGFRNLGELESNVGKNFSDVKDAPEFAELTSKLNALKAAVSTHAE